MTFEQQMRALMAEHDLSSISITLIAEEGEDAWFTAVTQGGGKVAWDDLCREKMPSAVLARSLERLQGLRTKAVSVPELQEAA